MKAWWIGLEQRERVLVAIAAILTAIVLVWQFAILPATAARAEAKAALEQADTTLARLQEAYMRKRARGAPVNATTSPNTLKGDAFKTAVTSAASEKGLSISRIQGGNENTIGLIFESADPRFVFFWLEEVETRLGGAISRLVIEQAGGGRVRVSVDVTSGAN
jgi:type II secretory pathway component PulM